MGIFSDLFSTKPAEEAARAKQAGYAAGNTNAGTELDKGLAIANPLYDHAYGDFSNLASKFGKGQDTYNDATGVNGAEGIGRAGSLFKSLPGYAGGLTTGIDAVDRGAAARGALGGGNTSADIIKFASDYDANKYGNFVSNLAPNLSGVTTATAGGAGVLGAEAGANLGVAGTKATNNFNAAVGSGNAEADAKLAPYGASSNFWSALMGGAGLALKASGIGGFAPTGGGRTNTAGYNPLAGAFNFGGG